MAERSVVVIFAVASLIALVGLRAMRLRARFTDEPWPRDGRRALIPALVISVAIFATMGAVAVAVIPR
jgi:hypothetical protein